jgi:SNW domain-containing protein 1
MVCSLRNQATAVHTPNALLLNILWRWVARRYASSLVPRDNVIHVLCQASSGNTLALQVDSEGNVRYDAIAHQGQRPDKHIQSQFKDLIPLAYRKDLDDSARSMGRPSEEEVMATAEKTRAALEKITNGKIKASQPKHIPDSQGKTSFIRYTPGQQNGSGLQQRIIKMTEVVEDPLEPPRFKHKKIPRGPPSPPPPVLRSPPRKATAQEQKDWMIPPCISNWKNNKGFTIPLDKRLAADGRGLQDVSTRAPALGYD